ncbi:MAG: flagellar basal body rod protein FlgC [Paludibaculum sp.]|nr:flagellar basal body rod protein FlgC [Acidobacteriota bacterium]
MSLFNLLSVSASGMAAQRARAEVIVENLANSETTRTPEGGPYRRKDVVFESEAQGSPFSAVFQTEMSAGSMGVGVSQIVEDSRPPDLRYQPGHPHADARGYVAFPHMSPAEEMVDLMGATRGYQANVAAISAVKDMVSKSIDLMK